MQPPQTSHGSDNSILVRPGRTSLFAVVTVASIAVGWAVFNAMAQGQSPVRKPVAQTSVCATENCHTSIVDRPILHKPVEDRDCLDCHEFADPTQHTFTVKEVNGDTCITCHKPMDNNVVHGPVAAKECLACHEVHGSDHPSLLIADPAKDLCLTCHDNDQYLSKDFVHGPVAVGACIICHEPHSSAAPSLLRKSPPALCQDCHSAQRPPRDLDSSFVHDPAKEDCTLCHDPHASNFRLQLKDTTPELCYSCHTDFPPMLAEAPVTHGPVTEPDGCPKCHNPHFSEVPKLQKIAQPELCLDCHNKPVKATNGKILTDMAELLADNPHYHGPIREGKCTACHQPHADKNFRLLHNEYPPEFYAPFDIERYKLCFSCHQPDLVLNKAGTGLTGFREGDQNLHFVHVNRENGRSCRACHEVHASKEAFHIRESVPYGDSGWMLPINFQQAENGGSCAPGCHKKRSYDRTAIVTPPDSEAAIAQPK
jgi:predicted CXXCH cytochrome family protein